MKIISAIISMMLLCSVAESKLIKPTSISEMEKTSVRIVNKDMNSGGSGSIFWSTKKGSYVLTNKHVCRLIEQGGYVLKRKRRYKITHYKKYTHHDLCLVKTNKNFNISLKLASSLENRSSKVYVSGHPLLLPHIVSPGHLSENLKIKLVIGLEECDEEDKKSREYAFYCYFMGGKPVFDTFSSTVVSSMVQPGNSGSAVFNSEGEVIGVLFAGKGRGGFAYGLVVPQLYVTYFLKTANMFPWVKVGTPVDNKGLKRRFFSYDKVHGLFPIKDMIWRK